MEEKPTAETALRQPSDAAPPALEAHRARIDEIDAQLVSLLNARQREALQIRAIKESAGLARYDAQREQAIVERAATACEQEGGPLSASAIRAIYERIFEISKE